MSRIQGVQTFVRSDMKPDPQLNQSLITSPSLSPPPPHQQNPFMNSSKITRNPRIRVPPKFSAPVVVAVDSKWIDPMNTNDGINNNVAEQNQPDVSMDKSPPQQLPQPSPSSPMRLRSQSLNPPRSRLRLLQSNPHQQQRMLPLQGSPQPPQPSPNQSQFNQPLTRNNSRVRRIVKSLRQMRRQK